MVTDYENYRTLYKKASWHLSGFLSSSEWNKLDVEVQRDKIGALREDIRKHQAAREYSEDWFGV